MKLKYKYGNEKKELLVGIDRVLLWTERCVQGQKYDLDYIAGTLNIQKTMAKDILEFLSIGGFVLISKNGEYSVED